MKISMGGWAFSFGPYAERPVPFEQVVERLAAAGYEGIELCGFPPHITLQSYPTGQSRRELKRYLEDHRLGISGYAADFSVVNPITEGNRHRYLDLFRRNVELCADLGSPSIRVDTVAAPGSIDDRDYQDSFERLAETWLLASELAAEAGVRVDWEFEPGFVFNKPSEVLALHRRVAHPNFRILFDTAHAYLAAVVGARQHGAPEILAAGVPEFLKKVNGRVGAIHLADSDGTLYAEETSTHAPLGTGCVDFKRLIPLLLEVPGIEWWCIDLGFWAGAWDLVESSRDFVRTSLRSA